MTDERLQAHAQEIRAARATSDAEGRLSPHLHRLLVELGVYKLLVPCEYEGAERALPDALSVFQAAGRIDGAFGWNATIGAGGGVFAAWLPDDVAARIYRPPEALIAGSGAPNGDLRETDGELRVSGRWRYASGIHHATWVTASVRDQRTDGIRAIAVPAAEVIVEEDWDVDALRGTGSCTMMMDQVQVAAEYVFDLTAPPRIDRTLYRFPFMSLAEACFAAAVIGTARGALDAFTEDRAPQAVGGRTVSGHDAVRQRVASATMSLRAAEVWLQAAAQALWRSVAAGPPDAALVGDLSLAAVHASRAATSAVGELAEIGGMAILQRDNRLGRAIRDTRAMAQHVMISPLRAVELGAAVLQD